jgi:hypothetical protein
MVTIVCDGGLILVAAERDAEITSLANSLMGH